MRNVCQVGKIGGEGSHWWQMARLKGSSKIKCFKIMFIWTERWWVVDI